MGSRGLGGALRFVLLFEALPDVVVEQVGAPHGLDGLRPLDEGVVVAGGAPAELGRIKEPLFLHARRLPTG